MAITTISSREFNQDTGKAKRAARRGPVFITDRGRTSHVLLTIEEYEHLSESKPQKNILELLAMPEADSIEFDPPRLLDELPRAADLE